MGLLTGASVRAALGAALLAAAPPAAASGLTLGARLAWAPAVGSAADRVPISEELRWQVPIQADAVWRLPWGAPAPFAGLSVGAYASWGRARAGTTPCADGAACSGRTIRAGAQALWTFAPWILRASPWAGAAFGWEWASSRRERLGAVTTTRWNGPELAIQGGAAWHVGGPLAIGPFALVGLGQYSGVGIETQVESASASVRDRAVHAWIQLGVRGTIDFGR